MKKIRLGKLFPKPEGVPEQVELYTPHGNVVLRKVLQEKGAYSENEVWLVSEDRDPIDLSFLWLKKNDRDITHVCVPKAPVVEKPKPKPKAKPKAEAKSKKK